MVNTFPDFHNQGNDIHMCRLHAAYLQCCCFVTSVVSNSVDPIDDSDYQGLNKDERGEWEGREYSVEGNVRELGVA